MNQAGKVSVKVHSASSFQASPTVSEWGLDAVSQVYCVCEVPGYGRLCTEPCAATCAGPDEPMLWEQELTFEVGPSEESKKLRVALYAVTAGAADMEAERPSGEEEEGPDSTDEFIGSGSMSLAHLEEVQQQHNVRIPIVTPTARQRDSEGREFIDWELAAAGPATAAKLLNERSPHSPTAPQRPGSPRIKPPPRDPPVPGLQATVRSNLTGKEE